jgi:hypothetical protein
MIDAKKTPVPDGRLIELQMPNELGFWIKVFNVSQHALIRAVVEVGHRAQDVKDYLEAHKSFREATDAAADDPSHRGVSSR